MLTLNGKVPFKHELPASFMLVYVVKPRQELFDVIQRKKICTLQSKEEPVLSVFKKNDPQLLMQTCLLDTSHGDTLAATSVLRSVFSLLGIWNR